MILNNLDVYIVLAVSTRSIGESMVCGETDAVLRGRITFSVSKTPVSKAMKFICIRYILPISFDSSNDNASSSNTDTDTDTEVWINGNIMMRDQMVTTSVIRLIPLLVLYDVDILVTCEKMTSEAKFVLASNGIHLVSNDIQLGGVEWIC